MTLTKQDIEFRTVALGGMDYMNNFADVTDTRVIAFFLFILQQSSYFSYS